MGVLHRALGLALVLSSLVLAGHAQACLSPYGFLDFEPQPLVAPGGDVDMAPIDVSASSVDDMYPKLVSFRGSVYSFWVKETGTTEVSENIMCRFQVGGGWSDLWAVNNDVPENGSFDAADSRVAGYDILVHEDLLYVFWSTPYSNFTHGKDSDIVYRAYDGTSWGEVVEVNDPDDDAEDVQPTVVSTGDGLLLAWTSNSPSLADGTDMDVVCCLLGEDGPGDVVALSPAEDTYSDFIPELFCTDEGAFITWYRRELVELPGGSVENTVAILGRGHDGANWSPMVRVSQPNRLEDIWLSGLWDGERLCMVWQRGGYDMHYSSSEIIYREWDGEALSPERDITGDCDGSYNGRPRLAIVEGELRAYWHTNDDALTLGTTYDLVLCSRREGGHWGRVEVFREDPDHDLQQVYIVPHGEAVYASWVTDMAHPQPPDMELVTVWDVVVGPVFLPPNPLEGVTVSHSYKRTVRAWGPHERVQFTLERHGEPMEGSDVSVSVLDGEGDEVALLEGVTDDEGTVAFIQRFESAGAYTLNVTVEGEFLGPMAMVIAAPPPGHVPDLAWALVLMAMASCGILLAGRAFVGRSGVVRGRKVSRLEKAPRQRNIIWRWASKLLTDVVKHRWAQGFLQTPMFVLFAVSIYLGYFGTQDPQRNFTSMLGWAYYLAGMLFLYAIMGRLWCYFEACGFVDTWCKNLIRRKRWLEWPEWLKNLWPGFVILLAGFWVEIVLSIDLYPWAVATFMVVILAINLVISTVFSKRTYCRFVCRDGVVEELIARYSILRIGVQTRPDSITRANTCIWKDEEKRPGYCSMCFTCVQNDSTVREATVEPAIESFARDVYLPQAVHRDEATAAVILMGISIPYMLGLTQLWWEDLFSLSVGLGAPVGPVGFAALGALVVVAVAAATWWAFRRWSDSLPTTRRALVVIVEGMLLANLMLFGLGGEMGRLLAIRSTIVLGCFVVPFLLVWGGELLVVRLTGNARGETGWRLLERYGLTFVPLFLGVLVARNLPIIGTWGWAAWDITKATFADFPGGAADVVPRPFVDPSLHFILGVVALAVGVAVGAYAALQLSRRLYKEERNALAAFGVHTAVLTLFAAIFAVILALPPF